jgi:hypothetical protein
MLAAILILLLAALMLGYAGWFLFEFIRYLRSGQYEIDRRIREVTHQG